MQFKIVLKVATAQQEKVKEEKGVYFLYLEFIESVTMAPRDPLVQSQCMKEQPYARAIQHLSQKTLVTRGGWNKLLVADSQTDYKGFTLSPPSTGRPLYVFVV